MVLSVHANTTEGLAQLFSELYEGHGRDIRSLQAFLAAQASAPAGGVSPTMFPVLRNRAAASGSEVNPCLLIRSPRAEAELGDEAYDLATDMAKSYKIVADGLVNGLGRLIHVIYDANLRTGDVKQSRRVFLAHERPDIAKLFEETTGEVVSRLDALVVFGPEFAAWEPSQAEFVEELSRDIALILERIFPSRLDAGPATRMIPSLQHVAGTIMLADKEAAPGLTERTIAHSFLNLASQLYGNAQAVERKLSTEERELFQSAAHAVADAAADLAQTMTLPIRSIRDSASHVHQSVKDGLAEIGILASEGMPA